MKFFYKPKIFETFSSDITRQFYHELIVQLLDFQILLISFDFDIWMGTSEEVSYCLLNKESNSQKECLGCYRILLLINS